MLTLKQRSKAIFNCFYFGIMPSWVYEKKCHYTGHFTYYSHLKHNLNIARLLVCHQEPERHHAFYKAKAKYTR